MAALKVHSCRRNTLRVERWFADRFIADARACAANEGVTLPAAMATLIGGLDNHKVHPLRTHLEQIAFGSDLGDGIGPERGPGSNRYYFPRRLATSRWILPHRRLNTLSVSIVAVSLWSMVTSIGPFKWRADRSAN